MRSTVSPVTGSNRVTSKASGRRAVLADAGDQHGLPAVTDRFGDAAAWAAAVVEGEALVGGLELGSALDAESVGDGLGSGGDGSVRRSQPLPTARRSRRPPRAATPAASEA